MISKGGFMNLVDMIKTSPLIHGDPIHGHIGYIDKIREHIQVHPISDIVDEKGHQYVDLVLQGGGVLGIALIGYTYTLEKAGIRFLNIAGTSAGAVNATLLAAVGYPNESKSDALLDIFNSMDFESFIDGGHVVNQLLKDVQRTQKIKLASLLPQLLALYFQGKFEADKFGLNPGDVFENWMGSTLEQFNIKTTHQLMEKLKNPPLYIRNLAEREDQDIAQQRIQNDFKHNALALVAAEVSTESKIIFPQMAKLFWENPLQEHPKKYVRASMSIPLFFEYMQVHNLPKNRERYWKALTGFKGEPPQKACLVDGALVSNFPIDIFHKRQHIPLCPTFGVKLSVDRTQISNLKTLTGYLSALFDTARHTADYSFMLQNNDYEKLIAYVDTAQKYHPPQQQKRKYACINLQSWFEVQASEHYDWLEFNMSDDKKKALFELGAKAAHDFIVGNHAEFEQDSELKNHKSIVHPFNWSEYKLIRKKLIMAPSVLDQQKKQERDDCSI